jgi:DNA-binding NarL/FixJ family response regulator
VSGNLDPDLRRRLVDAGLAGFVQKPYTAEAMLGTVREVLRAR